MPGVPLFPEVGDPLKRAYVIALAETGNRRQAARAVGIHPVKVYASTWRQDQPFQAALKQALECGADMMEDEARRRAVQGVDRLTGWYQGEPGGVVTEYSDILLMFLLKGIRPDKYKDRMELRGALANIDLEQLPDALLGRIASGENIMSVLASAVPLMGEQGLAGLLGDPSGEVTDRRTFAGEQPGRPNPGTPESEETPGSAIESSPEGPNAPPEGGSPTSE